MTVFCRERKRDEALNWIQARGDTD